MPDLSALVSPWIGSLSIIIEIAGVAVIVVGILWASYKALKRRDQNPYREYRRRVGRSLLLGLELLVGADIVRTVALELTPESLGSLALLVLIRTFLSWALEVEIEGRWPWQRHVRNRRENNEGIA